MHTQPSQANMMNNMNKNARHKVNRDRERANRSNANTKICYRGSSTQLYIPAIPRWILTTSLSQRQLHNHRSTQHTGVPSCTKPHKGKDLQLSGLQQEPQNNLFLLGGFKQQPQTISFSPTKIL